MSPAPTLWRPPWLWAAVRPALVFGVVVTGEMRVLGEGRARQRAWQQNFVEYDCIIIHYDGWEVCVVAGCCLETKLKVWQTYDFA